jgi:PQQ-dependent catabolism-associated beta-propeller protein
MQLITIILNHFFKLSFILITLLSLSVKADNIVVSNEGSDNITIISLDTFEILNTIESGNRPRDMHLIKDTNLLLVAASEDDTINIIDINNSKIIGNLETGDDPEIFDISPDGKIAVVSNEDDNEATVIDVQTGKIIRVIEDVGIEPEGVNFTPDGRYVFITSEGTNTVIVIDPWKGEIVDEILVGNRPRRGAFTQNGEEYWVTNELGGTVTIINSKNFKIKHTIAFEKKGIRSSEITPVDFAMSNDGKLAYITLGRSKHVAVVQTSNYEVIDYILAGSRVWGAAITSDDRTLIVTNGNSDDISIIDTKKRASIKSIAVGRTPHTVRIIE